MPAGMKKLAIAGKLKLRTETVRTLDAAALARAAGGMLTPWYSHYCCTDDSSGDGLMCPDFAPTTRN